MTKPKKGQKPKSKYNSSDVFVGVGKELLLVGLYGVKDLTGIDLHHKPKKGKSPWEKKWGEK
ncbi:hypothetical protein [Roseovarius phycicola]|uniref:Uncharacterized protein n=1 Tax=Roseovarius phycicola TaxID=3080976 RepID=A0ABZ2HDU1_9RHOB